MRTMTDAEDITPDSQEEVDEPKTDICLRFNIWGPVEIILSAPLFSSYFHSFHFHSSYSSVPVETEQDHCLTEGRSFISLSEFYLTRLSLTSSPLPSQSTLYDKEYANYSKVGHCGQGRLP